MREKKRERDFNSCRCMSVVTLTKMASFMDCPFFPLPFISGIVLLT